MEYTLPGRGTNVRDMLIEMGVSLVVVVIIICAAVGAFALFLMGVMSVCGVE